MSAQPITPVLQPHAWPDVDPWDRSWQVDPDRSSILEDELVIHVRNLQPRFLALFFHRRKVIHFATQEDVARFSRFTLPESLDPLYDGRGRAYGSDLMAARPLWFNVRLDDLAARVIRPDGTWAAVDVSMVTELEQVRTFRTMEPAWTHMVDLRTIAPGDVVELTWSYMVPYDMNADRTQGWRAFAWPDNWTRTTSWRILFHHALPIKHQTVRLDHDLRHGIVIGGTSFYDVQEDRNKRSIRWEHHDLPGCLDEVNADPTADLPYASITFEPDDQRYWTFDRLSGVPYRQPYWLYVLRMREQRAFWWRRVAQKNVPDKQNQLFNDFVDATIAGIPAKDRLRRVVTLHNRIAEEFTYSNDSLWYQDRDQGLARFGDQVTDGRIREMARYDLYAKLLYAIQENHATAYVMDRRVGKLDARWLTPLWESDLLFGVDAANGVLWLYPKRGPVGYWAGELPFYWEGTPALVMNERIRITDAPPPPLFVDLPKGMKGGTQRVIETTIDTADAPNGSTGTQRVLLSGQFSTLGRGSYEQLPVDRTVHPNYAAPTVPGSPRHVPWKILSSSHVAPYRVQAERGLAEARVMEPDLDGSYTIDARMLVHHAVPPPFDPGMRELPFYWDCPQDDRIIVDLHFERPMELVGTLPDHWVSSSHASISQRFTLVDPHHLQFESRLVVSGEREEVTFAADVAAILRVAAGEASVVRLRPVSGTP